MSSPSRVQLRLVRDSGSIHYQDAEDDMTFYIESLDDIEAGNRETRDVQALDLCQHFFRQHLIKQGYASNQLTKFMKTTSLGDFMKMVTETYHV